MSELTFDDVSVRFGSARRGMTAVDGVTLTIPDGSIVGLVGESGSGKSTLGRAAVGLTPLHGGQILLDGQPVPTRGRRRPLQMVFQDPYSSLDPRMSIGASVAEALPTGLSRRERGAEVDRLLELVHLDADRATAFPFQLSGGQRQRVALARALAARPDVIIADEITSALDVSIQGAVLNLVRELQRELNLSMLFISHNLAVVRYVSTHIAVMYLGRVVEFGTAAEVLGNPQHPYTRELLAATPGSESGESGHPGVSAEPADPHHLPSGCRYRLTCPVGPLTHPDRDICVTSEPSSDHRNEAACHFAEPLIVREGTLPVVDPVPSSSPS